MSRKVSLLFWASIFLFVFLWALPNSAEADIVDGYFTIEWGGYTATVDPAGNYSYTGADGAVVSGQASLSDIGNFVANTISGAEVSATGIYDNGSSATLTTTMTGNADQNLAQMSGQTTIIAQASNADTLVQNALDCNCLTGGEAVSLGTTVSASGQGSVGGVNFTLSVQGVSPTTLPGVTPQTPRRPGGPTIANFRADPTSVGANGSTILTWVSDGESASISFTSTGGVGVRYAGAPGLPGVH
ncbi:MAG: hypothetical protein HY982_03015, partial [Candidatus Magasanikbacteria bacterium]|nr:hypothetical protein [Candidatus Magasanikbacteria bacterium]